MHYIIPRVLEKDFADENGEKIVNKFGYLKQSILNNIERLKNNDIIWDEELGWFKDVNEDLDEIEKIYFKNLQNLLIRKKENKVENKNINFVHDKNRQ